MSTSSGQAILVDKTPDPHAPHRPSSHPLHIRLKFRPQRILKIRRKRPPHLLRQSAGRNRTTAPRRSHHRPAQTPRITTIRRPPRPIRQRSMDQRVRKPPPKSRLPRRRPTDILPEQRTSAPFHRSEPSAAPAPRRSHSENSTADARTYSAGMSDRTPSPRQQCRRVSNRKSAGCSYQRAFQSSVCPHPNAAKTKKTNRTIKPSARRSLRSFDPSTASCLPAAPATP